MIAIWQFHSYDIGRTIFISNGDCTITINRIGLNPVSYLWVDCRHSSNHLALICISQCCQAGHLNSACRRHTWRTISETPLSNPNLTQTVWTVHIGGIVNSRNVALPCISVGMVKIILQMNGRCDGCRVRTGSRNITRDKSNITSSVLATTKEIAVQGIVIQIGSCNDFHFFKLATVICCRESHNSIITSIEGIVFPTTFERRWLRFHTIDSQLGRHFRTRSVRYSHGIAGIGIHRIITIHDASFGCYTTCL